MFNLIAWLLVGAFIGWVASLLTGVDRQQGLPMNIVAGMAGAVASGSWLSPRVGIASVNDSGFSIGALGVALLGAMLALALATLIRRAVPRKAVDAPLPFLPTQPLQEIDMNEQYENNHGTIPPTPSMPTSPPMASTLGSVPAGDDMLGRIVRGAHDTVDRVAAKAAPMVEQVKGGVSHASEAAHARADQIGQLGDEWTQGLRSTVREHPIAALAVALAVGVVISRMSPR